MNTDPMKMAAMRADHRAFLGERFNPAMLTTAREAKGQTQKHLADLMGVSQPLIGQWEASLSLPSHEQIEQFAKHLGVQANFMFVDRPRRLATMSDFYHRAFSRAKRGDVKSAHARCSIVDLQIDRLLNLAPPIEDRIPSINPDNHAGNIEKVAAMARVALGVEDGPIPNLISAIESAGGIVIDRNLVIDDIDALCRWVPGLPKLFFINGGKPADRIRFSLAHELGHTIMHFERDCEPKQAEVEADKFASAFMMPQRDIRCDFSPMMGLAEFAGLKRKWRMSIQSLVFRAKDLGMIDQTRYQSLFQMISRNGWRKTEPINLDHETPQEFARLVHQHIAAGYSTSDLAKLMFVSEEAVERILKDVGSPTWAANGVRMRMVQD